MVEFSSMAKWLCSRFEVLFLRRCWSFAHLVSCIDLIVSLFSQRSILVFFAESQYTFEMCLWYYNIKHFWTRELYYSQKCFRGRRVVETERCKVREKFFLTYGQYCQDVNRCTIRSVYCVTWRFFWIIGSICNCTYHCITSAFVSSSSII